jgi:hypothetical protein
MARYDSDIEALETETFEALQAYARNLSERIIPRGVETHEVVVIDITGVAAMDVTVANHLGKVSLPRSHCRRHRHGRDGFLRLPHPPRDCPHDPAAWRGNRDCRYLARSRFRHGSVGFNFGRGCHCAGP